MSLGNLYFLGGFFFAATLRLTARDSPLRVGISFSGVGGPAKAPLSIAVRLRASSFDGPFFDFVAIMRTPKHRRTEQFTGIEYKPYALAIGQLSLAWNDLHEALALLFIELLANGLVYPAQDIWNAQNFDRPKRTLIRAVIKTNRYKLPNFTDLQEKVTWLLDEADKLEDARNDAIHSPLVSSKGENLSAIQPASAHRVLPLTAFGNRRALKLGQKELLSEFRWCRQAAITLRDFAHELYDAAASHRPCREIPSLPNRGQRKTPRGRPRPALAK